MNFANWDERIFEKLEIRVTLISSAKILKLFVKDYVQNT